MIELYLTLEKLRFKKDLEYSIEINEVEDIMIPPMLIQPFIENAIEHGIFYKKDREYKEITRLAHIAIGL